MDTSLGLFLLIPVSFCLTGLYRAVALRVKWVDTPDERSSHHAPTPHGGGLVFVLLWCVVGFAHIFFSRNLGTPLSVTIIAASAIALISFCDDIRHLSPLSRLVLQTVAASGVMFVFFQANLLPALWLYILLVPMIVWSTNLYNFMDGMDGQASVEAFFVFGTMAYLLFLRGDTLIAPLLLVLLCLVSGFLIWNWPPAKIFMGDAGSTFLGFLVVPLAVLSHAKYQVPYAVWILLYFYFLGDTFLTVGRRILNLEKFYLPHNLYAFQRLYQSGFSRLGVLSMMMGLNTLFTLLALVAYFHPQEQAICLILAGFFYFVFYIWVEYRKPMYGQLDSKLEKNAM